MTRRAQDLLRKAMRLSPDDRAEVAAELLASLETESADADEVQTAWAKEIEARARGTLSGESPDEPWEEVRTRIKRQLSES